MTVAFAAIVGNFERIFGFIRRDLEPILNQRIGGNFAAAALIACACEVLAKYRYGSGKGEEAFKKLLPDDSFQTIAGTLYDELRNGLVHNYNARDIRAGAVTVRLAISWRDEPHLSVRVIEKIPNLVLNVNRLGRDLFHLIEDYRAELQRSGEARDRFYTTYRRLQAKKIETDEEIAAWQEIAASA